MKFLIVMLLLLPVSVIHPVFAQEAVNPSLIIHTEEIPASEFNMVQRDAPIIKLKDTHAVSWQVTIDNNLLYIRPDGSAVFRIYDQETLDEFIEIGMGSEPDNRYWVAVQTPKEGYIVIHKDFERGWYPQAKSIVSYTDRAGLTVNNGARIVVTNLDIGVFAVDSYSTYGLESSTDPPAVGSGSMTVEFLSGDPSKNIYSLYPFVIAAVIGSLVGVLFITKKRS